nr:alpha/beta fold hydrolase [Sinorhizobium meliloti]
MNAEGAESGKQKRNAVFSLIGVDKDITLRRMVVHSARQKGTVLFLHGFPETSYVWIDISIALGADYEVHAFDWPGYGLSSRPAVEKFSYAPKDYADVLHSYIEKAGIDRSNLTIYATDIGALPALLLALREPDIAQRIIVGDFAPFNRPAYMYESLQSLKAEPAASKTRDYMNKTSNVSAVSAPLDRLYFEAGWACEKVSRTIWRFAWQVMDLLGATKLSSRAAETDVGRML